MPPKTQIVRRKETTTVSIVPEMNQEEADAFNKFLDDKQHAEYLCYMMLNALNTQVPLKELLKLAAKKGWIDEETVTEFCGEGEDAGCCSAEGFTVDGLLNHWSNATDKMMRTVIDAARR